MSIGTADFNDGLTSGSVNLNTYGIGNFTKIITADSSVEATEKFFIRIRTGSVSGPIVASSNLITVIDNTSSELYPFSTFTFTNGGATGSTGPTSFASISSYTTQVWYSSYFSLSNGIQYWTPPINGNYLITAAGAGTGNSGNHQGIIIQSTISLTKGQQYKILIGQAGQKYSSVYTGNTWGGGGGTFMSTSDNVPVIVAGGGGGPTDNSGTGGGSNTNATTSTSGNYGSASGGSGGGGGFAGAYGGGGGGFYTDGTAASTGDYYGGKGRSFINGGYGGIENIGAIGGFGGGGSGWGSTGQGGGGGGGYSGGGGDATGGFSGGGGGGGSYSQTAITFVGYNRSHGYLTVSKL
jgi:tripartite motif-containing protein 56